MPSRGFLVTSLVTGGLGGGGLALGGGFLFGGALSAVRAQCNYLGVWPY